MSLRKRTALILGACLMLACFAVLLIFGRTYSLEYEIAPGTALEDYSVTVDQDESDPVIRVSEQKIKDGKLCITIEGQSRGRCFVSVSGPDDYSELNIVHVLPFRIVSEGGMLGYITGAKIVPICGAIFLLVLLILNIYKYREDKKKTLYQYKNVRNLGWILFNSVLLLGQIKFITDEWSLVSICQSTLSTAYSMALYVLPVALIISFMVIISNIHLMHKEGRTWRNMLGVFLSIAVFAGTIFPVALDEWLYNHQTMIEIHNQRSPAIYIEMGLMNVMLINVVYLELVLVSTIILSIKAARHIPAFDKEYILIHGCQIRKDGTLTKLLQSRADRALEFAAMQKEATGKAPVFVPSGGKGSDEVISEAEAITNYLKQQGIPGEQILVEDKSTTTKENMEKSRDLILSRTGGVMPKIAFATTNYHVFRSGVLAEEAGLHAEGIGSPTKRYFWVNAFIREFIATLVSEKKKHFRVLLVMWICIAVMSLIVYVGNAL